MRSATGETLRTSWEDDAIPQQLHISRLPSGSLSLGPGQVAIVPVTFFPRYPNLEHDNTHRVRRDSTSPPSLSATAAADLLQIVGEEAFGQAGHVRSIQLPVHLASSQRRSNLDLSVLPEGDEFEVSTTVLVDTSHGVVRLPISASSVRQNSYGIPDAIRFHRKQDIEAPSGSPSIEEDLANTKASSFRGSSGSILADGVVLIDTVYTSNFDVNDGVNSPTDPELDCYDIFISNPSLDREMEITDVLVSIPEMFNVEFDPERLLAAPDNSLGAARPAQAIQEWMEGSPMYIPPDSQGNYIATVCLAEDTVESPEDTSWIYFDEMSDWIDYGNPESSLGFLQIKTTDDTLFVSLQWEEAFSTADQFIKPSDDHEHPALLSSPPSHNKTATVTSSALLKAVPDSIEFRVMSSNNPITTAKIALQNKSPVPMRLMRVSFGMDTKGGENQVEMAKRIGLKMNVTFGHNGQMDLGRQEKYEVPLRAFILPAAETVEDALVVSCSVKWDSSLDSLIQETFSFSGTMILRGTMDTELNYNEWRDEMLKNPYRDDHLVLEIPYTISVLNGRVEVIIERSTHPYPQIWGAQPWDRSGRAVSAFFFPQSQLEVLSDPEDPLPPQKYRGASEVGHDLRIITNMGIGLNLEGAEIHDENGVAGSHLHSESLCRRFNVSIANPVQAPSNYAEFNELGYLSLQYNFGRSGNVRSGHRWKKGTEVQDVVHTTTCYLKMLISPVDAGVYRVPLIVFPGQLDVSTPSTTLDASDDIPDDEGLLSLDVGSEIAKAVIGFNQMVSWFRETAVGQALRSFLSSVVEDKRTLRNDSYLLGKYLLSICGRIPDNDDRTLRPILLKAGAIEHSEMVHTPIYLTNHNPVPVKVMIEVGEVEGMSITLGRDASRGHGDGNNLYDYIPKEPGTADPHGANAIVKDGKLMGHPLKGLRHFLLTNDLASSFSTLFPYRDAVSLSTAAVSLQPMLRSLYQWHSYAEFHRRPLPRRFLDEGLTRCQGSMHPPLYNSLNESSPKDKNQQFPGPFLISGDGSIARSLGVCWDRTMEAEDASEGTSVLIPPGGVARFDVQVRAPSQSSLKNDISQLLATGLVLSTSYGEVLPIVSTFEALQGQLHVSHVSASGGLSDEKGYFRGDNNVSIIRVPLGLSWDSTRRNLNATSTYLLIPPAPNNQAIRKTSILSEDANIKPPRDGISLFLKSTFSREVRLLKVESCNPWFQVFLNDAVGDQEMDENFGINIGAVRSVVSCDDGDGQTRDHPSYYQCALKWLEKRAELQPRGCGLLPDLRKIGTEEESAVDLSHARVDRAVRAFERVLKLSKKADAIADEMDEGISRSVSLHQKSTAPVHAQNPFAAKSGTRRMDGLLSPLVIDVFAEAWDAMKFSAEVGLRTLSTSLRARIEYDTHSGDSSRAGLQNLALTMHNLAVETVLTTPRLFDVSRAKERAHAAFSPDGDEPALVEFTPAHIATVTSLMIPLRNPTSVPVRVRIGTAPPPNADGLEGSDFSVDETVRSHFLGSLDAPYVQNGKSSILENEDPQHLWWDGGGAYFISDERGDIVRSYHNITIRAGAGAHVSLVNPSLHSSVAFLVGCGSRCGVRDDPSGTKGSEDAVDPKLSSPIGASAASGTFLLGRKHLSLEEANTDFVDEIGLFAGGTPIPGTGGPSAFAIPYSALDEIIIPPFGVGEIGPVFFRPPGRFGVLGCESAIESNALLNAELCASRSFESMVFLENSLTGLERIVLRGKGMWEQLHFLDPIPEEGADAFGDIEFRNGRPTLLFSGTSERIVDVPRSNFAWWRRSSLPASTVVKEVVVHNSGDVQVAISHVYFSHTSRMFDTEWLPKGVKGDGCSVGRFRILNCWDSNKRPNGGAGGDLHNVRTGFKLRPGENRSIFVEHVPDCSPPEEFVSLIVEFRRDNISPGPTIFDRGMLSLSRSGEVRNSRVNEWKQSFRKRHIDLLVGYSMDNTYYALCKPVDPDAAWPITFGGVSDIIRSRHWDVASENRSYHGSDIYFQRAGTHSFGRRMSLLLLTVLVLLFASTVLTMILLKRQAASTSFWSAIRGSRAKTDATARAASQQANVVHSNWQAAFRCLARADPTSSELQTLGREQIRQVIFSRYRAMGVVPPQCFNSGGVFSRERYGQSSSSAARQRSAKAGNAGNNERKRTLSDSIFQNAVADRWSHQAHQFPLGLGWRIAAGRGMLDDSSALDIDRRLKTTELLTKRSDTERSEMTSQEAEASGEHWNEILNRRVLEVDSSPVSETTSESDEIVDSSKFTGEAVSSSESEPAKVKVENIASKDQPDSSDSPPREEKSKSTQSSNSASKMHSTVQSEVEKCQGVKIAAGRDGHHQNTTLSRSQRQLDPTLVVAKESSKPKLQSESLNETAASARGNKGAGREKSKDSLSNSSRKQKISQSFNGKNDGASARKRKTNLDETPTGTKLQGKDTFPTPKQQERNSTTPAARQMSKSASSKTKKPSRSLVRSTSSLSNSSSNEDSIQGSGSKDSAVRPPPGLAPPPGFGGEDSRKGLSQEPFPVLESSQSNLGPMLDAVLSTPNVILAAPVQSDVLTFSQTATNRGDLLFPGSLADGQDLVYEAPAAQVGESPLPLQQTSPSIGPLGSPSDSISIPKGEFVQGATPTPSLTPIVPLLEERPSITGGGFDVMDFLDSILDEGSAAEEYDAGITSTLLTANAAVPVLSNPWASERKSRAAAYGISFDDDADDDQHSDEGPSLTVRAITPTDDSVGFGSIPLLTPAAILSAGQDEDDSVGGDKETSFFASLIGE